MVPQILFVGKRLSGAIADDITNRANAGWGLWLAQAFAQPAGPGIGLADVIEATFPGYGRQSTAGKFAPPFWLSNGQWFVSSSPFEFSTTSTDVQPIVGAVAVDGGEVQLVIQFSEAVMVSSGIPCRFSISCFIGP